MCLEIVALPLKVLTRIKILIVMDLMSFYLTISFRVKLHLRMVLLNFRQIATPSSEQVKKTSGLFVLL